MADLVVVERRAAVSIVRLNRPEARNALSPELIAELGAALDAAVADDGVRAVVLTGTGDRAFCAGMDLRAFSEGRTARGSSGGGDPMGAFGRFIRDSIPKPIIGAAQATAVAGGFELLLACDLIVASSAAQFGIPEAKRGLFAAGGGVFLSARIPLAQALELGLTGDLIDAQRALALGLINKVVPPERVLDEAIALAERITANGPLGVCATKELMRLAATGTLKEAAARQAELQPRVFGSEDAKEGALAFVERRAPNWKGR
ncbi:MAG TPA: enoyl-CoA hydratase-related protein [Myxococcota bacterium]|nr:enoyl-CoA hydratase-related protein [Myxococcota bacterium]